jgi:1-acyl-sn-glycerol-3-phosphate acyltransferase
MLRIPVIASFLRATHFVPVYRKDPLRSRQAVDSAIDESSQLTIAIFPEGTRTASGNMNTFKKGFVHILRGSNLDILPITLNGFYRFMPRHSLKIDPRAHLEIVVHPPIRREDLLSKNNEEIVDIVSNVIHSAYRNPNE